MEKTEKVYLAALNLSEGNLNFFKNLSGVNVELEVFNSPEGMFPWLKHTKDLVIILVNSDCLLNQGHNEIDKLLDLLKIEPILGVNPVIAISNNDNPKKSDIEELVLEKGFAADILTLPCNEKYASLKLKNIISIYQSRYKIEMDFLAKQEHENRKRLISLQAIDKETGIFNREAFSRRTEELIRSNPDKNYIVVRWDIDRFKVYNDTFGVRAGDALLRAIGKSYIDRNLQSVVYGHWGSDHFIMCMEEKSFSGVAVHKYISEQISLYRPDFEFVVRMGVYRVTDPNLNVTLMADRAFMAMKSIKKDFEKRIAYYDDSMRDQMMEEQELITAMEPAIQNEEFQIYFQPQYNYATGKMTGAEALVRWVHPKKGMISPVKFIPLFEQNGFICHLDEYIWDKVCKFIRKWIDNGLKMVPVSVNISRRDIYNPKLCDFIINLTNKYEINPSMLRLEITESAYMEEPAQLIRVVEKLKNAGFVIEMDDFGSGYSSLNTLKDVPVDILKLDLKFLSSDKNDGASNKRGGSIMTSIVRMAHWLNLPIIAEGIETVEQAEFLKSIGCYTMQGFLFSRPIPEADFLDLMDAEDMECIEPEEIDDNLSDAIDFLNPIAQKALLFNSFVGGAAIVERSFDGIDAVRINDKFFETIGVTREEYSAIPHNCLGCYSEKYRKSFADMLEQAKSSGKESSCILHCDPMKEGMTRYWTRNRARYLASAGEGDIFYVAVENITENMHLLHENEKMNKELMTIMDTVPCGILTMTVDSENCVLDFANKAVCDMLGYTSEEFKNIFRENTQALFAPGEYEINVKRIEECIEEKRTSFASRVKMEKKNGLLNLVFQQGAISYGEEEEAHVTIILLDMNQQIEGDVSKFGMILNKVYDEIFEVNYDTGKLKFLGSNISPNSESGKTVVFHDAFTSWIKNYVADEDKKKVAMLLDLERIRAVQSEGEAPYLEFAIEKDGQRVMMSTTLLQIEKSTFFICNKKLK